MSRSEEIRLPALTKAVNDNFPNLILEFVEHNQNTNRSYGVDLGVTAIKFIDKARCVVEGQLTVANKPFGVGTVEYQFNTGSFYRVSYSDKTTRSRKLHTLELHNKDIGQKFLAFISNYWYAEDDHENNVNINGSTPSKKH